MSRKMRFMPEEKEQAVIDYLDRNKPRTQICEELSISSRTIQDWAIIYNKHGILQVFQGRHETVFILKNLVPALLELH